MPLAEENVQSLAEYGFFTVVSAGDYVAGFGAPENYRLDLDENRLTLHFTLPLAVPLFTRSEVLLQVYDPEYYIAFALPSSEAVRLVEAPAGCRLAVTPARGPDAAAAAALATIGPEQRELPPEMQDLTGGIDNSATINCGGPTVAASAAAQPDIGAAESAGEATRLMVEAAPSDLSAMPAETAPDAPKADPVPPSASSAGGGFTARLAALQLAFSQHLTEALKGLKADGSVFWWLGGLSFLYGIVHAAGPGHGKVVISSYLLANEERVRRGVAIAFLAALVQALVAIGLVGVMAALLDMTGRAMTRTAGLLETGSFALVAALGLYLLARKGRAAWAMFGGGDEPSRPHPPRADTHPAHVHTVTCGCHHHVSPAALEKRSSGSAAAAVLSVGIRPCSGALVVLVFALAQGIFWAGVASTFLMALGTAIAVAALAALAVGAKGVAQRLAGSNGSRSAQVMLGLEVMAALLITALGAALFVGSLSA
jgi:ABC-type nickel/cobalt efflux system permease component RcnA